MFLPRAFVRIVGVKSGAKHSILLSNIPGFLKPVSIKGGKVKKLFAYGTGTGNISTSIMSLSTYDTIQFTVVSDAAQIDDLPLFMR